METNYDTNQCNLKTCGGVNIYNVCSCHGDKTGGNVTRLNIAFAYKTGYTVDLSQNYIRYKDITASNIYPIISSVYSLNKWCEISFEYNSDNGIITFKGPDLETGFARGIYIDIIE